MFQALKQKVKIVSINPRAELHGEDRVPAFDIKCAAVCESSALIDFHPELRRVLFTENDEPDLFEQAGHDRLTALRFPRLGQLKWDLVEAGYEVRVAYGIGGASDICLADCKVDDFRFLPHVGGTVEISFRVTCHPHTADIGRLCELIQQVVVMDVTPPEPASASQLFGGAWASTN